MIQFSRRSHVVIYSVLNAKMMSLASMKRRKILTLFPIYIFFARTDSMVKGNEKKTTRIYYSVMSTFNCSARPMILIGKRKRKEEGTHNPQLLMLLDVILGGGGSLWRRGVLNSFLQLGHSHPLI